MVFSLDGADGLDAAPTPLPSRLFSGSPTVFREEASERIGIGFDLPKPAVVSSVPRNTVEVEVENAVEIVVK
jgi:hypothetical protein